MSFQAEEKLDALRRLIERAEGTMIELKTDKAQLERELGRAEAEIEILQRDLAQAYVTIEEQAKRLPGRSR
jgi:septal ring factor EnvC (AmiA/AmiB activator)